MSAFNTAKMHWPSSNLVLSTASQLAERRLIYFNKKKKSIFSHERQKVTGLQIKWVWAIPLIDLTLFEITVGKLQVAFMLRGRLEVDYMSR